mmetsp:Transcript_1222/g.3098  ORF Transcript_1222/g.3098 Transcript_1222/m.3098 type:complete len:387 (+) Transcript_1222:154-1314(+)
MLSATLRRAVHRWRPIGRIALRRVGGRLLGRVGRALDPRSGRARLPRRRGSSVGRCIRRGRARAHASSSTRRGALLAAAAIFATAAGGAPGMRQLGRRAREGHQLGAERRMRLFARLHADCAVGPAHALGRERVVRHRQSQAHAHEPVAHGLVASLELGIEFVERREGAELLVVEFLAAGETQRAPTHARLSDGEDDVLGHAPLDARLEADRQPFELGEALREKDAYEHALHALDGQRRAHHQPRRLQDSHQRPVLAHVEVVDARVVVLQPIDVRLDGAQLVRRPSVAAQLRRRRDGWRGEARVGADGLDGLLQLRVARRVGVGVVSIRVRVVRSVGRTRLVHARATEPYQAARVGVFEDLERLFALALTFALALALAGTGPVHGR